MYVRLRWPRLDLVVGCMLVAAVCFCLRILLWFIFGLDLDVV